MGSGDPGQGGPQAGKGGGGQNRVSVDSFRRMGRLGYGDMAFREGLQVNDPVLDVKLLRAGDAKHAPGGLKKLGSGLFAGLLDAVAAEEGGAGGTGALVVGGGMRVSRDEGDFIHGDAENLGGQLGEGGFGALPHVAEPAVEDGGAVGVHL